MTIDDQRADRRFDKFEFRMPGEVEESSGDGKEKGCRIDHLAHETKALGFRSRSEGFDTALLGVAFSTRQGAVEGLYIINFDIVYRYISTYVRC